MVDKSIIIYMLLFVSDHTTIHPCLSIFTTEGNIRTIASHSVMQRQIIDSCGAGTLLIYIHVCKTMALYMCLLQFIQFQMSIFAHIDLTDLSRQELVVVNGMIAE